MQSSTGPTRTSSTLSIETKVRPLLTKGKPPVAYFFDRNMRELEHHNLTFLKSEAIADLLRSKGFPDSKEEITFFHPKFVKTEEHFAALKKTMTDEEHKEMMTEMKDMLEYARGVDSVNDDVTIDDHTESLIAAKSAYIKIQRKKEEVEKRKALEGISMNDAIEMLNFQTRTQKTINYKKALGFNFDEDEGLDVLFSEAESSMPIEDSPAVEKTDI